MLGIVEPSSQVMRAGFCAGGWREGALADQWYGVERLPDPELGT